MGYQKTQLVLNSTNVPLLASSLARARQNKLEGSAIFLSLKKRIDLSDIQLRNSADSAPAQNRSYLLTPGAGTYRSSHMRLLMDSNR